MYCKAKQSYNTMNLHTQSYHTARSNGATGSGLNHSQSMRGMQLDYTPDDMDPSPSLQHKFG